MCIYIYIYLYINISYYLLCLKNVKIYQNICLNMFIYTDLYAGSHRNTQNNSPAL